jgi:phage terminase large subunit
MSKVKLLPIYKPLFRNDLAKKGIRYLIVTGGRASAKSFHGMTSVANRLTLPNQVALISRYTMVSANISVIPEFMSKIELFGRGNEFVSTKSDVYNKFSKSRAMFRGIKTSSGDQTAKLKSIEGLNIFVVDEAEELLDFNVFDTIDNSIRTKGSDNLVMVIMNPSYKDHWVYQKFIKPNRNDTIHIHSTYLDNLNNLDKSFLAKAEGVKQTDPKRYEHIYLGEWLDFSEDLIFPYFEEYETEPQNEDFELIGLDFGYSTDPSAAVQVTKKGNALYLKEILYKRGLVNQQLAEELRPNLSDMLVVCDSANPQNIQELRNLDVPATGAKKGQGSVQWGLQVMQGMDIFIHKDSHNLKKEFRTYRWARLSDGTYKRNTLGDRIPVQNTDDHLIDASRYGTTYYMQRLESI